MRSQTHGEGSEISNFQTKSNPGSRKILLAIFILLLPLTLRAQTPAHPPLAAEPIRGLYASGWAAGSEKSFNAIVNIIENTDLNAIVIDVKASTGRLSYISAVPLAVKYRTGQAKIPDIKKIMTVLREKNIFPIARIVAFQDPLMAAKKPEWAVRDKEGAIWTDRKGLAWIDPYNRAYWDYLVDIAREAIENGFGEIQFDYVRFTSDGAISNCVYPARTKQSHQDLIAEFLRYAKAQLAPLGKPVSADVFGLTTKAIDDVGIGQNFDKIAAEIDVICPMVYPSHYASGADGAVDPDKYPYRMVYNGVLDGMKRLQKAGSKTVMRPWLQAFSIRSKYDREQIQAQIQAAKDAGATEWLFWNPQCRYPIDKFR